MSRFQELPSKHDVFLDPKWIYNWKDNFDNWDIIFNHDPSSKFMLYIEHAERLGNKYWFDGKDWFADISNSPALARFPENIVEVLDNILDALLRNISEQCQ